MQRVSRVKRKRRNQILILCQGKTEEVYLKSFPIVRKGSEWSINIHVEAFPISPKQLIEKSIEMRNEFKRTNSFSYNSIWCIFDKDDFKSDFRAALELADTENINHSFAIESFELWLLMHFKNISIDNPMGRDEYITELNKSGRLSGYCKNEDWLNANLSCKNFGKKRRDSAIENSKILEQKSRMSKTVYKKQNCTIHKIVEYLLKLN